MIRCSPGQPRPLYGDDLRASTRGALEQFVTDSFRRPPTVAELHFEVAVGKPATEIARLAQARGADLIVMSTHGRAGMAKDVLRLDDGAGAARNPHSRVGHASRRPWSARPRRIAAAHPHGACAPVDLSAASERQIHVAAGLADALQASLVLMHVLEPLSGRPGREAIVRAANDERRALAIDVSTISQARSQRRPQLILTEGDPAAEIAKVARERQVGAIVVGLHSTTALGSPHGIDHVPRVVPNNSARARLAALASRG